MVLLLLFGVKEKREEVEYASDFAEVRMRGIGVNFACKRFNQNWVET
jgi:hypothetical protein